MNKGEFVRHKADQIEAVVSIAGADFTYNILTIPQTDHDERFHKYYSDIMLVMKDRGYKVWGTGDEGNGVCKWHITL